MAASVTAFIIDGDRASRKAIEESLNQFAGMAVAGTAGDLSSGYDSVLGLKPALVLIDLDIDRAQAYPVMEKMIESVPGLSIFATSSDSSSETILKAMHAGASDFLLRPVSPKDLFNSLKKIGHIAASPVGDGANAHGKAITCFSPKGGMGNTSIATNLAVSLHLATGKQVVLVDLDLEGGDADIFLNLRPRYTISDANANISKLDAAYLRGVLARHDSGIYLLGEPKTIEEAGSISPDGVRAVISQLKKMFPYVVVDTVGSYSELNLAAFDVSDLILAVGILSLPSIRGLQKSLDVFGRLGMGKEKVKLVVNRYLKKSEISIKEAERTLNYESFWKIPNDYNSVITSINRGQPLPLLFPHAEISKSYKEFADQIGRYFAGRLS
jgi:pilus assembly protein CpaE